MAITYSIGENPWWFFVDDTGRPLAGGYMATQRTLNPTQQKIVYQDAGGTLSWPYVTIPNQGLLTGILFDGTGTQGPFYWQFDTANPDDTYFIQIFDSDGVLIRQLSNYIPNTGGGGGNVQENIDFNNLIVNCDFFHNIGTSGSLGSISDTQLLISPGAHALFGQTSATTNRSDIRFIKTNLSATDQITFPSFTPGTLTGDITPPQYLEYKCSVAGSSETYKYLQFPISSDIQSTSGQVATMSVWMRCTSGNPAITVNVEQVFGDGGSPSAAVRTVLLTQNLTSGWVQYTATGTIASIAGKTLGACQNTGVYLTIGLPLNAATTIDVARPSLFLGSFDPTASTTSFNYQTQDQVDAIICSPRTGDVRVSLNSFYPLGWLLCNDLTIGNPSSGATNRANFDTFPLFDLIWNTCNNTLAPIYNSMGVPIGSRGATSVADYANNYQLGLTKILGRAIASQGQPSSGGSTPWAVGFAQGAESVALITSTNVFAPGTGPAGAGNQTIDVIQPTAYFNVFLKL